MDNKKMNYDKINIVINLLIEEKRITENNLQKNLDEIREIDLYLQSLYDKEDADYELFSPRNIQSVYKDKIEEGNSKKYILEESNKELYGKINSCHRKIQNLQDVLEDRNDDVIIVPIEKERINDTILDIQEKERQRIARDLHDSTVQNLIHLIHKIELASKFADQDVIRAKMELISVNKNIKGIINDMRNIIFDLRPMEFDDIGIVAAFDKLLLELQMKTNMTIFFHISEINLEKEVKLISLFHIVQECCNNAIKHSQGTILNVSLEQDLKQVSIIIEDNGVGFDIEKQQGAKHFGLTMTKERVSLLYGKIDIQSSSDSGTKITVNIPN